MQTRRPADAGSDLRLSAAELREPRPQISMATTLAGMALGDWLAGAIYDGTGSYAAALINGIAWNIVNMAIVFWLLQQMRGRAERAHPPADAALQVHGDGHQPAPHWPCVSTGRSALNLRLKRLVDVDREAASCLQSTV